MITQTTTLKIENEDSEITQIAESIGVFENESVRRDVDIISQFRANLSQLEDLQGRLRFVMNEVSHIIKKRT